VLPLVSRLVLREVEQAVLDLKHEASAERFQHLMERLNPTMVPMPLPRLQIIEVLEQDFSVKDAHVVAGARSGRATHLVTLNRTGFLTEQQWHALRPIIACTPVEFMKDYFKNKW
jgi:predicted nucleic acid-binding protein